MFPIHATSPSPILLDFIIQIMLIRNSVVSSSLCSCLQAHFTLSLSGPEYSPQLAVLLLAASLLYHRKSCAPLKLLFLGAFAKVREIAVSSGMTLCLFVRNSSAVVGRI
jgi:hypothetical protein